MLLAPSILRAAMISGKLWIGRTRFFNPKRFRFFEYSSKVELKDERKFRITERPLRLGSQIENENDELVAKSLWRRSGLVFADAEGLAIEGAEIIGITRDAPKSKLRTGDEVVPISLNLVDGRREFGTSAMQFWHHDYESFLSFRTEEELLFPAMFVAFFAFGDTRQR